MRGIWLSLSLFGFASLASAAHDFTAADELLAQRASGTSAIEPARAMYKEVLDNDSADLQDRIYAATQIARLDVFLGDILTPVTEKSTRKAIFKTCMKDLDTIAPENIGGLKTIQYFMWKAYCTALFGKSANTAEKLMVLGQLKSAVSEGMAMSAQEKTFEGGGIYRITAGVYSNPEANSVNLYKPEEALVIIDQALKSDAYPWRAYPTPLAGTNYYDNYVIYCDALKENGRLPEALAEAKARIQEVQDLEDNDSLPEGREPESLEQKRRLQAFVDKNGG